MPDAMPTVFSRAVKGLLLLLLCLHVSPALAVYNANDESRLNTAAQVNDPNGNLNWNPSPATVSDWTGVTWVNVSGQDRVSKIEAEEMGLSGNLNLSTMTSLGSLRIQENSLTGLDVNGNTALTYLDVTGNNLRKH